MTINTMSAGISTAGSFKKMSQSCENFETSLWIIVCEMEVLDGLVVCGVDQLLSGGQVGMVHPSLPLRLPGEELSPELGLSLSLWCRGGEDTSRL